jgi:hypothetical protein
LFQAKSLLDYRFFIDSSKFIFKKIVRMKKLLLSAILLVTLSACSWQQSEDPFAIQPEDKRVTLEGEIFPFDVSVSTKATHRLENNGSLAALLTSDIVRLDVFERKKVSVTGVKRTEKMREILVVEKVELQTVAIEDVPEKTEARFLAKDFTFVYPSRWTYSTSPDGLAYFAQKDESLRRVFLKFKVASITPEDRKLDLSVQIAGLTGIKDISTDELDREVQKITLFSNIGNNKYEFEFTASYEEFDKKKSFFALLNSFTEGEEAVLAAKELDLKQDSEILEKKLEEEQRKQDLEELIKNSTKDLPVNEDTAGDNLSELIDKVQSIIPKKPADTLAEVEESFLEEITEEVVEPESATEVSIIDQPVFINLINANAFAYASAGFGFNMKVPFGFWFRNFGAIDGSLMTMGFADQDFSALGDADFTLEIQPGSKAELTESKTDTTVSIAFSRNEESHFILSGPVEYRNAMYSIWSTLE